MYMLVVCHVYSKLVPLLCSILSGTSTTWCNLRSKITVFSKLIAWKCFRFHCGHVTVLEMLQESRPASLWITKQGLCFTYNLFLVSVLRYDATEECKYWNTSQCLVGGPIHILPVRKLSMAFYINSSGGSKWHKWSVITAIKQWARLFSVKPCLLWSEFSFWNYQRFLCDAPYLLIDLLSGFFLRFFVSTWKNPRPQIRRQRCQFCEHD